MGPGPSRGSSAATEAERDQGTEGNDEAQAAPPSYDYLFGHTSLAAEHRKLLAGLDAEPEDDDDHDAHDDESAPPPTPSAPNPRADKGESVTAGPRPTPSADQTSPATPAAPPRALGAPTGGLISSVPWAKPADSATANPTGQGVPPASTVAGQSVPDRPTFTGRHTPPPAPSLLPPMPTAPAGPVPSLLPSMSTPPSGPVASGSAPPTTPPGHPAYGDVARDPDAGALEAADVDEIDLTVDRSALLEAREAARGAAISGPSVLAVLCASGHPSPPHSERCRICGVGIPPQDAFSMPRPPLGVLRLSTGDVVTLDRSVLLGRAPKASEGLTATEVPHVVKVPSPERDVSRNHVEVMLEGWHVLIRDLATTNGTTVTLPGQQPVRLRANDQQVLEPGSIVSMADDVSFTFEVGQ